MERFESLLEAYGGNLARWPARHVLSVQGLLRDSTEARTLLAEAQALDRVLDKASRPDPQRLRRLADRIVETAAGEMPRRDVKASPALGRQDGEGARVIRLPLPKAAPRASIDAADRQPRDIPRPKRQWPAAAALAASLVMGMMIGLTDIGQTTTLGVASLAGAPASDTEVVLSTLQIDSLNMLDEDQI